jgi:GTPase SAR1 family protein
MESCLKFLPRKSYNTFGFVVLTLFVSIGVVIIGIASNFESKATLQCLNPDKTLASDLLTRKYIETQCFLKYAQEFYPSLPLYVLFLMNFGLVLVLSIIYAYLVKHRVEIFADPPSQTGNGAEEESQPLSGIMSQAASDPMAHQSSSRYIVFTVYGSHVIICRILPLVVFAGILLKSMNFPVQYNCHWSMNSMSITRVNVTQSTNFSIVGCTYPMSSKNEKVVATVITINFLFGTEAFIELAYLLWSTWKDRSLLADVEFCCVYLLRKRKRIGKVIKNIREKAVDDTFYLHDDFGEKHLSRRKLEEIYINVIIQEGRESTWTSRRRFKNRHETYEAHLQAPNHAVLLSETADLFKFTAGFGKNGTKTILVVGRPGIGKTLLTKKILHEWQQQSCDFWHGKIVILIQFRTFNQGKTSLREMLEYAVGLDMSIADFNCIHEHLCLTPSDFVLIFDGLDELKIDHNFFAEKSVNNPSEVEDVVQIFKQLVKGKLLPGVTVLTTSRPTAEHIYRELSFDREVEILGFHEEQIKDYVEKFCRNDVDKSTKLWNFIKQSPELLSLSYIPVNCYIICLTLKESTDTDELEVSGGQSFQKNVPRTITELYKRAIKILLFRHHANYKDKPIPKDYIIAKLPEQFQNDLDKLKEIARNGMIEDQLVFEFQSGNELADCGIINQLDDKRRNIFSFLHLTLQEFLAAQHVIDDMDNVESFLSEHIHNPRWHLVIQFVAGLIGDKMRELKEERSTTERYRFIFVFVRSLQLKFSQALTKNCVHPGA